MSGAVLVVTGARALLDTEAATWWAAAVLSNALDARRWRYVAHGGAPGPDTWVDAQARARGVRRLRYALDGWLYDDDRRTDQQWATERDRAWYAGTGVWPLRRNVALVRDHARADACVLGLRAPWAQTNGTAHTLALARAAGLATWEETCPAEYGPKGGAP